MPLLEQRITITNNHLAPLDAKMLLACLTKCCQQMKNSDYYEEAQIYTGPREPGGWLEWRIVLRNDGRPRMTIGAIQRSEGAEYEFHS